VLTPGARSICKRSRRSTRAPIADDDDGLGAGRIRYEMTLSQFIVAYEMAHGEIYPGAGEEISAYIARLYRAKIVSNRHGNRGAWRSKVALRAWEIAGGSEPLTRFQQLRDLPLQ